MVDLGKISPEPQTFKAHLATVTLRADRVEVKRGRLAKLGGNKDADISIASIAEVQRRDPTRLINGYVYLAVADDQKTLSALATATDKQIAGNPHAIMFTWQQRSRYADFLSAIRRIMPDVPNNQAGT